MKRLTNIVLVGLLALSLSSCIAGKFMSNVALNFEPHGVADIERTRHKADSLMTGSTAWYDGLKEKGILRDTNITAWNGNRIHACYVPAKHPCRSNGTAIVVHGYSDNHYVFLYLVRMYRDELNYNVLFPDLQYHGYSEGDHAQMGWFDRFDVIEWAKVAHKIWNDDFMVLHGVSMGAATVMMASGDEGLPEYVRCVVEDCGYSSVVAQLSHNLSQSYPWLPKDILQSASLVTRNKHGWGYWEASAEKQVAKSTVPMLFIHGDADDFVPFSHMWTNYNAKKTGYKEYWVAPGAVHANSYAKYPEEYTHKVSNFLKTVHNLRDIEMGKPY